MGKFGEQMGRGETIRTASFAICFVLSAWFVADLLALLAEKYIPSPPVSVLASRSRNGNQISSPMDYEVIANRNLFSSKQPKKANNDMDMDAEPVLTTLPLTLVGTVVFQNPARSIAAIQDKTENKMYPVRPGDEIQDKVQILSVDSRRVVFLNTQARRREYIELPDDPAAAKISGGSFSRAAAADPAEQDHFALSRADVNTQLANIGNLLTQARAVPETRGGQMIGFKLVQINPGSFYEKQLGLKANDIIKRVNGEAITDPAKAMAMLGELSHMQGLDLTIERNGKDSTKNYDISK
jgi:type II secretion system protein C